MENIKELNLDELEKVTGGKLHFKKQPEREGWIQHEVKATDTLIRIAKQYDIPDWRQIRNWNPHINHETNLLHTGEWLWIKKQ